jgi:molybdopterin molybdotransferase
MALPTYAQALELALRDLRAVGVETVNISGASGRVLAEAIRADRDAPPFNRAQMDGYALRAADYRRGEAMAVAGEIAAGSAEVPAVPRGACVKIATGAAVPEPLDAVIEHEKSDRGDPVRFTVDAVQPWRSIHRRGADAKRGDVVLAPGVRLGMAQIGIAAAAGVTNITVHRKVRVAIVTSGDEVVAPGMAPEAHQIRNSNAPMLSECFGRFGGDVVEVIHLPDDAELTRRRIGELLGSELDLIVTVGGVSAGERDFFPGALEDNGAIFTLRGAGIQPGRPVACAKSEGGASVLCLPGNPVSSLVCAHLFGWPLVKRLGGEIGGLPWCSIELGEEVKVNPQRQAYRPACVVDGRGVVPRWSGSGDLIHTASTHGILELPMQPDPARAGDLLRFLPWA